MTAANRQTRAVVLGLILLSASARLVLLTGNQGQSDATGGGQGRLPWRLAEDKDDYLRLAQNVAEWSTFGSYDVPTAYRPPLYPLILAPVYWLESHLGTPWGWRVTAIGLLQLIFGVATTLLTYRLGLKWGLERWSLLAAALVAVDPILLQYTRLPMTETLAALFVVGSLNLLAAGDRQVGSVSTFFAGVVLGLGMLCRTPLWSFVGLAVFVGGLVRDEAGKRPWRWAATVLAVALAVQLPWIARNWRAFGSVIPTTTHGGYTILLGNNDVYYDQVLREAPWSAWPGDSLERWQNEMRIREGLADVHGEVARDAFYYGAAWRTIRSRPGDFALSVILRIINFWRVTPHASDDYSPLIRLGCAMFYVPVFLSMIVGLFERRVWQWPIALLPAALLSLTLVHSVYWSDMRMRAPIMPAVAILAAMGAKRAWMWRREMSNDEIPNV